MRIPTKGRAARTAQETKIVTDLIALRVQAFRFHLTKTVDHLNAALLVVAHEVAEHRSGRSRAVRWGVLLVAFLALGGCATARKVTPVAVGPDGKEMNVRWVGHPVVSDNHAYTPSQGWLTNFQIGFRSDGTVVWRELPKEKK